ncbi:MAG TPA: copper chaperone PCu(A)C [Alphaproteobacteria bacterium]|nr:copper chaperone PCu(A)C [Alphaproteobacteria bacterium]
MRWIVAGLLTINMMLAGTDAAAEEGTPVGALVIEDAWTRPIGAGARTTAIYLTIRNTGGADDRLLAATSEAAERVELHVHRHEGDVARMAQVPAIAVPGRGQVALAPGAAHVMLIGPKSGLAEGATLPLTLVFEKAGRISLDVPVRRRAPLPTSSSHGAGHGGAHK